MLLLVSLLLFLAPFLLILHNSTYRFPLLVIQNSSRISLEFSFSATQLITTTVLETTYPIMQAEVKNKLWDEYMQSGNEFRLQSPVTAGQIDNLTLGNPT
jgi:uncharacterized protein (UPF0333 family)